MKSLISGAICAFFLSIVPAFAATLVPGGVVNMTGITVADPVHGGVNSVINDNLIFIELDANPLLLGDVSGGNLQNRVARLSSGFLSFAPRFRDPANSSGNIFSITEIALSGFGNFSTITEFKTDGSGDIGPETASRSVDGNVVTLSYGTPLIVGTLFGQRKDESFFPSIVTDATRFALTGTATIRGYVSDIDGNQTGADLSVQISGLAVPISAVPLPASVLFLMVGVAGFGALRRRN